ncbi:TRAP transporter small permease [Castellaniella sp.]|uniref:TRAP transporter small permease n=1 Tax=Castellaniella sp. TaxID=1955812 RepID=UPI0035671081
MVQRFFDHAAGFCLWISKAAIIVLAGLICTDIFARWAFRAPVPGAYELVGILGALTVVFALPAVQHRHAFIRVEIVTDRLTPRARGRLQGLLAWLEALVFAILAVQFLLSARTTARAGEVTDILRLPQWPVYAAVAVAFALVSAMAVQQTLAAGSVGTPDEP